jgi:protein tyrosine/serine phosphatase
MKFLAPLLAVLVLAAGCASRGLPPRHGVANFGRVNEGLYRGAQPDDAALDQLQRLGVKSVVNLRGAGTASEAEELRAQQMGIIYTNVPLRGLRAPSEAQVTQVIALLKSLPPPVFVHCLHGADRTGTIVACYRIERDGWTNEEALREAKEQGIGFWQLGMMKFIRNFTNSQASR